MRIAIMLRDGAIAAVRAWIFWTPLLIIAAWTLLRPAHAFDHGFDLSDPVVQWFDGLRRPDAPPDQNWRCCGKGDAYPIEIDAMPGADSNGVAHITDGSALSFPDGTTREPIENGAVFHFAPSQVTKPSQGNPTATAWAFLIATPDRRIAYVWCVVPLLPNS